MSLFNEHKPTVCALRIEELVLYVHLGCTVEERFATQEIRISVEFRFESLPKGAVTDNLDDTICYAKVTQVLREHCETREFNLVERIGYECFSLLCELTQKQSLAIGLHVHKVSPPVKGLAKGTHFSCGDFFL